MPLLSLPPRPWSLLASRMLALGALLCATLVASAAEDGVTKEWPNWGADASRNMVGQAKDLPLDIKAGEMKPGSEEVDLATTKHVKWVAKLGSQTYGNPTISQGKVMIGTNNEAPRDPKHKGDRGNVMCFEEATGKFLWQLVCPKLGAGKVSDWEYLGICSAPVVDGDRAYVVTNRCDVVCLDLNGLGDGNQGIQTEGAYMAGPGEKPLEPGPLDADIIWVFDMREELGVFPHNIASSSVLVVGDRIYVTTSNGMDWSHKNIPSPKAPALICLDKKTGALLGEEMSEISARIYHCNWSSPAYGETKNGPMILFGGGDGFLYGFKPQPETRKIEGEDWNVLPEIFRCELNPPAYKKHRYPDPQGPSEIIATPVFHEGLVYVSVGQDPEHGPGVGLLACVDPTVGEGDVTDKAKVWTYPEIGRSISTVSVADGLVFTAEFTGIITCLDAKTGKKYWDYKSHAAMWSSTLVADGKVIFGTEEGDLIFLEAGKELKELAKIEMGAPIYSTPVVANNVLYVATQTHLYAIGK